MMISGIDEAGRGCIIGPMVIAIASIEQMQEYKLRELGIKDSKLLSAKKREELFDKITEICTIKKAIISAKQITKQMDKYSLNEIEAIKIAGLLQDGNEKTVFIDSPDNIPENFEKRIRKILKRPKLNIVSENKADRKHPIVAAASIIAKVQRDREIEKIKKIVGYDFNSGYTSDKITIQFLKKHMEDEKVQLYLRHKWSTLQRLRQKTLGDY